MKKPSSTSFLAMVAVAASAQFISSCGTGKEASISMKAARISPLSEQALRNVSQKRIFFGHQSVGYNIVEGVGDVLREHPAVSIRVTETASAGVFDAPVFAHAAVGRNSDPESKIRDFAERIRQGIGGRADIAAFKFCYADFDSSSDPGQVFTSYRRTMAELAAAYPGTRFLHVTVPLKATSGGWKKYVKSILGKPHPFIADNVRRDEFNQLMRKEYGSTRGFFDLAALEATQSDGRVVYDSANGKRIPALAGEYTFDTGHLNERGRKLAAEQFLGVLSSL